MSVAAIWAKDQSHLQIHKYLCTRKCVPHPSKQLNKRLRNMMTDSGVTLSCAQGEGDTPFKTQTIKAMSLTDFHKGVEDLGGSGFKLFMCACIRRENPTSQYQLFLVQPTEQRSEAPFQDMACFLAEACVRAKACVQAYTCA
eukprot:scaffold181336_cov19-Tisochrysis_lutea.AAC.1